MGQIWNLESEPFEIRSGFGFKCPDPSMSFWFVSGLAANLKAALFTFDPRWGKSCEHNSWKLIAIKLEP